MVIVVFPLMISDLFSFRTYITWDGLTPLRVACDEDKEEIALFLINTERDRVRDEGGMHGAGESHPSYNMGDISGGCPVFRTSSARIREELLTLDDLKLTNGSGKMLLWGCAYEGWVSEKVATHVKLVGQYTQRWQGTLPLEIGENPWGLCNCLKWPR